MSVYKYEGDRENIAVTKMIALNSQTADGYFHYKIRVDS